MIPTGYYRWSEIHYLGVGQYRAYAYPLFCDDGFLIQQGEYVVNGASYDYVSGLLESNYPYLPSSYSCSFGSSSIACDSDCALVDENKIYDYGLTTTGIVLTCGQDVGEFISSQVLNDVTVYPMTWTPIDNGSYFRHYEVRFVFENVYIDISFKKYYIDTVEWVDSQTGVTYPAIHKERMVISYSVILTDSREVTDCCLLALCYPDQYKE